MNTNSSTFAFLYSNRFWALVLGALSTVLIDPSFDPSLWYIAVGKFLGIVSAGFITIRTVDRLGDTKVEAAHIEADSL